MSLLMRISFSCLGIVLLVSCSEDENAPADLTDIHIGSSKAIAIYNAAYNENYDPDQLDFILSNANKAYVLVDPFEDKASEAVASLHANGNQVGAYISIGTGEDWRADFAALKPYLAKQQWGEWPGEYFISNTTTGALDVMKTRIDQIAAWGFDWVEFDNMDWALYEEVRADYKLNVTKAECIAYFQELCDYVHQKGMKCMSKNVVEAAGDFDGVTYESYNDEKNWWDESGTQAFLATGKLMIIVHYNESRCNQVYSDYKNIYNADVCFICEDALLRKYVHYNE